jgi:DNA-binding NarL/FixJ family response regulator
MKKPSKREIDYWYNKLAKAGFEDAEERHSPREMLKTWHNTWFQARGTPDQFGAQAQYYQLATDMLSTYDFGTARRKQVWALHAEGQTVREIAKATKYSKTHVHHIIQSIKADMLNLT